MEPGYSQGYACWQGYDDPNISYEVEILDRGNVVATIPTSANFYHFDFIARQGQDYRIKAIDGATQEVIGTGGVDAIWSVPTDHIPTKVTCEKTCFGPDYAWTLALIQDDVPGWSINDPAHLSLRPAYQDVATASGAYSPYYQPMSPSQYYAWQVSNVNHQSYQTYQVDLGPTPSPPVYNAQGANLSGLTFFVQKKMEQFKWAENNSSTTWSPSATICSNNLNGSGGWIDRFNSYPHQDNSTPNPAQGDALQLSCTQVASGGGGGGVNPSNWSAASGHLAQFKMCILSDTVNVGGQVITIGPYATWWTIGDCEESLPNHPDFGIDHIEFDMVNSNSITEIVGEKGRFDAGNADISHLDEGLYVMTIVLNNGMAVSAYKELVHASGYTPPVDDTEFSVSPNPGPGNFTVSFNTSNQGTLTVTKLDGTPVFTQAVAGEMEITVDLRDEQNGLYAFQVVSANGHSSRMVIKN
ncbi:MAG: T9SS type A sorting domain-containing protein [Bacteroidota bacterium]